MKVSEVMVSKGLLTVSEADSLAAAGHKMAWGGFRHLPVVRGDEVVGVLSERDLLVWRTERGSWDGPGDTVGAAMSSPPVLTVPDEDVARAAATMVARRIDCLPVIHHGRLCGMLTTTDLVGAHVSRRWTAGQGAARARDVMTPRILTAHPDDPIMEAADLMVSQRIRHLPVVDATGRLVGILSERDVRAALGGPADEVTFWPPLPAERRTVADVMTRSVVTATPDEPWQQVAASMAIRNVSAVPVVDPDGTPVGIVSFIDLLHAGARGQLGSEPAAPQASVSPI